jgi:hypothetical protein
VGRQRGARRPTLEGIDALRLRLEAHLEQVALLHRPADCVGLGRGQVPGQDDVRLARVEPLPQRRRRVAVEAQDPGQVRRDGGPAVRRDAGGETRAGGELLREGHETVTIDRGRQGDGAAPVVDRAPLGWDLGPLRHLLARPRHQVVMPSQLPVGEPDAARHPEHEDERQEQQGPRAAVGPSEHRFSAPGR